MDTQAAPQPPEPISRGVYALYETPDGGAVLSYRPDGAGADQHQPIPAQLWQLLGAIMRGEPVNVSPMALMKLALGKG